MPAANDLFRRLLDSGVAFTQMTQERAEAIVRDLVRAGEVQSEQTTRFVQEILDQSRQNTERLLETIRKEIREQVAALNLADRDEVQGLRDAVNRLRSRAAPAAATATTATKKASGGARTATKKASAATRTPAAGASAAAKKAAGTTKRTAKKASGTPAAKKATGTTKRTAKKASSRSS
jgi:polyhydroxyalkanoate synthesis regulator phasin